MRQSYLTKNTKSGDFMNNGKNLGGRPRKRIDKEVFEKLCGIMCTEDEICGVFGITDKTLSKWCKETYGQGFSDVYKIMSSDGKISLRRKQWKLADKSAAMAIFLGKNYLGQKDVIEQENAEALEKLDEVLKTIKGVV